MWKNEQRDVPAKVTAILVAFVSMPILLLMNNDIRRDMSDTHMAVCTAALSSKCCTNVLSFGSMVSKTGPFLDRSRRRRCHSRDDSFVI